MSDRCLRECARSIVLAAILHGSLTALAEETRPLLPDRPSGRELESPEYLPPKPAPLFELPPVQKPGAPRTESPALPVKAFSFSGNKVVPTSVLEELAAPLAGRTVTLAELEELRQKISRYYVDRGYINSGHS